MTQSLRDHVDVERMRFEGRRSTGIWGAAGAVGVLGIVLAYFLYAYLYLSISVDEWPPASTPDPPLLRPAVLLGALVVVAGVTVWAARSRRDEPHDPPAGALAVVGAVGAGVVALGAVLVADLELQPRDQAYDAIVTTVHAVQGAVTLAGVAIAALTAFEAHRLGRHPWVAAATVVASIWWCAIAVGWIAVFGTLYVWPQLS